MARELVNKVKLQIPAGKATAAPPVGSSLGPYGINIPSFTKDFNEKTADKAGLIIPVVVTIYASTFVLQIICYKIIKKQIWNLRCSLKNRKAWR